MKAFVLGAGLGTRLRPLTEWLPKPMVPVFHRPLITHAFDHLRSLSLVDGIVINTHHCPEAYAAAFSDPSYRSVPLRFRHEPVLLETAGGIGNVADCLGESTFIVYNGDILADLPLGPFLEAHRRAANEVTLLLRSSGPGLHIALDELTGRVVDIRNLLESGRKTDRQFTGIYLVEPAFLRRLEPGKKESVIPIFLDMIRRGERLGGWVEDEGRWWDLGNEETYRRVHAEIPGSGFPRYLGDERRAWPRIAASAVIDPGAQIGDDVVIGPAARVEAGARLQDTILWPGARVGMGESLSGQVIRGTREEHFRHFFDEV